jgi:hypothetical protein
MSTEQSSSAGASSGSERLSADIRRAIELGGDIQETVRSVTLKALTKGELDTASLRRVAGDVLKGAMEGTANRGAEASEAIKRAVAGLDEAFAKAAEAATLAAKEASGRMREFTSGDLRRAMDDLKNMEGTFIDSLRDASKAGWDVTSTTLQAFADHAANSGTAVGRQVQESIDQLGGELGRATEAQIKGSIESGRATAALLARAASGFLAGIAEMIEVRSGGKAPGSGPSGGAAGSSSPGKSSSNTKG